MSVLLLNATYEPLRVITTRRAMLLIVDDKAELLESEDGEYHSASASWPLPSVIRLKYVVKVPIRARLPLTRRNVLARDKYLCAYCKGPAPYSGPEGKRGTIDHVRPRAKGGRHSWENVVTACSPCNARKDDKTLAEIGWKLDFRPWAPKGQLWVVVSDVSERPSWEPYLGRLVAATR